MGHPIHEGAEFKLTVSLSILLVFHSVRFSVNDTLIHPHLGTTWN